MSFKVLYHCNHIGYPDGEGVLRENPFRGGGMDNLWNYTMFLDISFFEKFETFWFLHSGQCEKLVLQDVFMGKLEKVNY